LKEKFLVVTRIDDQNSDWKFCGGGTFARRTPVTTLPVNVA